MRWQFQHRFHQNDHHQYHINHELKNGVQTGISRNETLNAAACFQYVGQYFEQPDAWSDRKMN